MKNKAGIIVGASKGIGRGIAEVFAREGAKLLLVGRNDADLRKISSFGIPFVGDVRSEKDMARMAEEAIRNFGRIDFLCHNAGVYPQTRLEEMEVQQWDAVIETNLKGTFLAVKACLPQMKSQRYGRIVLTSSISGPRRAWPGGTHYTASKAGMNGFMLTAAVELAKYQITINAVEPGNIVSEGMNEIGAEWSEKMRKAVPLGRLGTPEDVAKAHLFLASDDASYITGQSIIVDGGQVLPESHFLDY